jgi:hypothetical protein
MTFEQFQATRKWTDDMASIPDTGIDWPACGQVYVDGLHIESALEIEGATGEYVLTIGNCQRFGPLEDLERDLYDFAVSESFFTSCV